MEKDHGLGLLILLGIIGIALFGGSKNATGNSLFSFTPATPVTATQAQDQKESYSQEVLKQRIQSEEAAKGYSPYHGIVSLSSAYRANDPSQEYITLRVSSFSKQSIPITGWSIRGVSEGITATIPQGVYVFFSGIVNGEEDIVLTGGDTVYVITGSSPIGSSFKENKCSGYLSQFQTFSPGLNNSCPMPKNENLSSIPNTRVNDACLNYIESYPRCRIETNPLPDEWSYECKSFIREKINYSSCVDTHKSAKDFQSPVWYVYLKRSSSLWARARDGIVLYDAQGKIVDTLRY
jgi:hypothetical protein